MGFIVKAVKSVGKAIMGPITGLIVGGPKGFVQGLGNLVTALVGGPMAVAMSVVMALSSSLLSTKPKSPAVSNANSDRLNANIDPRAARKIVFGQTAMASDIRDQEFSGSDDEYLHRFLVVASHKVQSIDEIWFDDKKAWTSGGGVQGEYAGYLTVATRLEGTAANAINISARMGSTRRYTGLAYVHFRYKLTGNSKKASSPFSSSIPTRVTIKGKGMPVYDPRKDSTRGGTGTQRIDDQSTWVWDNNACNNPALQLLAYLTGWRINGKLAVGKGIPAARLNIESFADAANMCDEPIALEAGGTEPRYRTAGVFSEADGMELVLDQYKSSMNAVTDDADGRIRVQVLHNDLAFPIADFNEDDILGEVDWKPRVQLSDRFNVIRGSYTDPRDNSLYQAVDYTEISLPSPDGMERSLPVHYPLVQSHSTVQRLIKQRIQRAQYPGMLSFVGASTWWKVIKNDVVRLTFGPLAMENKLFRVVACDAQMNGQVNLLLREENAAIYLWDKEEGPEPELAPPTTYNYLNNPLLLEVDDLYLDVTDAQDSADAATLAIIPDKTGFTFVNGALVPANQTITLSAQVKGVNAAVDWATIPNIKSAADEATFTINNAEMAGNDSVVVVATLNGEVKASHTIATIADGAATVGAPTGSPFAGRTVDDVEQDINDAKTDIDDLFTVFGDTDSAAESAVIATEQAKLSAANAKTVGLTPNAHYTENLDKWYGDEAGGPLDPAISWVAELDGRSGIMASSPAVVKVAFGELVGIDTTRKYEVRCDLHHPVNSAIRSRVGWACYDSDGVHLDNRWVTHQGYTGWFDASTGVFSGEGAGADQFSPGTRSVRPVMQLNTDATVGRTVRADFCFVEDVTESEAAKTQAIISGAKAVIAADEAAAAKASAKLAASVGQGFLNKDSGFDDFPSAAVGATPTEWGSNGASSGYRVADPLGGWAWRIPAGAGESPVGGQQNQLAVDQLQKNGYYILCGSFVLNSGTLAGAGIRLLIRTDTGAVIENQLINFSMDPDETGAAPGAGTPGKTYHFRKLIQTAAGEPAKYTIYNYSHLSSIGSTADANDITWLVCGVMPATPAEIASGVALPVMQGQIAVNQGAIATNEAAAVFWELIAEATGSTPAIMRALAGKNGSEFVWAADRILIANPDDAGDLVEVARFEGGVARFNAALIRDLGVPPTPASEIFHPVMLRPLVFYAEHDDVVQYQGGASYGSLPEAIDVDIGGAALPALTAGEAYDIRATNITATDFKVKAVKTTASGAVTQTSSAGTNVGGTPAWQTNKPSAANAKDGVYSFTFQATLAKSGQTVELVDEGDPASWRYISFYEGDVTLYGKVGASWTQLWSGKVSGQHLTVGQFNGWTGHTSTKSFGFNRTTNTDTDLGSGAGRFGIHQGTGATITSFSHVKYTTQSTGTETAVGGLFKFTVHPPTA